MTSMLANDARVEDLRSMIDGLLKETDTYGQLRRALDAQGAGDAGPAGQRAALAKLVAAVERSPAPELLTAVDGDGAAGRGPSLALRLEIRGGSAFVGELVDAGASGVAKHVRAHVLFAKQRAATPLAASAVEPDLRGSFLLELRPSIPKSGAEWQELVADGGSLVRFAVTRENAGGPRAPRRELVATASVDWREALLRKGAVVAAPLAAAGPDSVLHGGDLGGAPTACLNVALDVVALNRDAPLEIPVDDAVVSRELARAKGAHAEAGRSFYLYAKSWWDAYGARDGRRLGDRSGVKLFARDETGELRCVCSYVHPLRGARCLDSPRHAARFVSLIPLEKEDSVGGGATVDAWHTAHAFLARGSGDVWDHATLLCSLLLGFGLDARVCVGTMPDGRGGAQNHVWVATWARDAGGPGRPPRLRVTAWESATGRRCGLAPLDADARARYLTVACVFKHDAFHANAQNSDHLASCSLDLDDAAAWAPVDPAKLDHLARHSAPSAARDFALAAPRLDAKTTEVALEAELRALIEHVN